MALIDWWEDYSARASATGRGSVSGYRPVPCLEIASTPDPWRRMEPDMDVDCGEILSGVTPEEKGREIFARMLDIASGTPARSEAQGRSAP